MSVPLVSVLVIAGTGRPYLAAALRSLVEQDARDWEAVVLPCAPSEDMPAVERQVAEVLDERVRVVSYDGPRGGFPPYASRKWNCALASARGSLVAFLDDDDMKDAGWLRAMTAPFALEDLAATVCSGTCVDTVGARHGAVFGMPSLDRAALVERCGFVTTGQLMVRRAVLNAIGGFDEALGCAEDYDLCIRLSDRPWLFVAQAKCLKRDSRDNACYHSDVSGHTQAALRRILQKIGAPETCRGCGGGFASPDEPFVWAVPDVGFRLWHYGCTGLKPGD